MTNSDKLSEFFLRLPEPDRSIITAKYYEVAMFPIGRLPGRSQRVLEEREQREQGEGNRDNSSSPVEWPLDFIKVRDGIDTIAFTIYYLPEPHLSEGVKKLEELSILILEKTFDAVTIFDMPRRFVQFSKDYQVGESTIRLLGLADEYGYTDEEAIEKAKFSMTSDVAARKLGPTSELVYWESPQPEGGEYIEGSFACTGVVYQTIPEQYVHQHPQLYDAVQVVDGEWQHYHDDSHIPRRFRSKGFSSNFDYIHRSLSEIDGYILYFSEPERSTALLKFDDLMQFVIKSLRSQTAPVKSNKTHLNTIIDLKDFTTQNAEVLSEIEDMDEVLVSLHMIVNRLTGDDRAVALTKFNELVEIIERVISKMTLPNLSKSVLFVQFAKDYRVGDSTTRIFGVVSDFGHSQGEVMANINFSLTNPDTAYIKLGPTSKFIGWQEGVSEGSEYIEGSFTCTGVVYPSFHEAYLDLCPQPNPLEGEEEFDY